MRIPYSWSLRDFENRVQRKIIRRERGGGGVTGDWIKLHNTEFHDFLLLVKRYSDDQITKNEVDGACRT
jgi:hypothetical protein